MASAMCYVLKNGLCYVLCKTPSGAPRIALLLRCYSTTPLLNVILIIVVHYGIFVPMLIHLKLKKIQKRALRYVSRQMTSPYEELLQISQKSPPYIVRLRKIAELVYMVSENMCRLDLNNLFTNNLCNLTLCSVHNNPDSTTMLAQRWPNVGPT